MLLTHRGLTYLLLGGLVLGNVNLIANARETSHSDDGHSQRESLTFTPPPAPQTGTPSGRRRGAATRGNFCREHQSVAALVPLVENKVFGLTTSKRPTWWFFVPQTPSQEMRAEFVVQDKSDRYLHRGTFSIAASVGGIISVSLPANATPLEIGQSYTWTLSLQCDPQRPSAAVFVQGTIQRVAPDIYLESQLTSATPSQRAAAYARAGIWHEALTILAKERRDRPQQPQIDAAWDNLLEQGGFAELSSSSLVTGYVLQD